MKRVLTIFLIILLSCGVAWAAMDSEVKRRAAGGLTNPTADSSIDAFDRGMITGVYWANPTTSSSGSRILFWHYHHH